MKRLILIALAVFLFAGAGPVEPPSPIRIPREELRLAFPDSVLDVRQFAWMMEAWRILATQIYEANMQVYESLRNPLIQSGIDTLHSTGEDSTTVILPRGYRDSLYSVGVAISRAYPFNHLNVQTGDIAKQWPDSFSVRALSTDSGTFLWWTIGIRK